LGDLFPYKGGGAVDKTKKKKPLPGLEVPERRCTRRVSEEENNYLNIKKGTGKGNQRDSPRFKAEKWIPWGQESRQQPRTMEGKGSIIPVAPNIE